MILLPWENRKIDIFFIAVVAILMVFGIFILKSAVQPRNMVYLLKRQILWDILGFSAMMSILLIKEEYIKTFLHPLHWPADTGSFLRANGGWGEKMVQISVWELSTI